MCRERHFTSAASQMLMHFCCGSTFKLTKWWFGVPTNFYKIKLNVCALKRSFGCTGCCEWKSWRDVFPALFAHQYYVYVDIWGINSPLSCFVVPLLITHYVLHSIIYAVTWVLIHIILLLPFLISIKHHRFGCFQSHYMLHNHLAITSYSHWFDSSITRFTFPPDFFKTLAAMPPGSWSYFGWSDQQSTYSGCLFPLWLVSLFCMAQSFALCLCL